MFEFGIKDIIDIVLVALMLYYIYRLMKESRSLNVFIGIMVFIVVWLLVSQILEMKLLGSIMDKLVSVGVIALIILFQDEIRKFFYNLGARQRMQGLMKYFSFGGDKKDKADKESIMPIVMACMSMGRSPHEREARLRLLCAYQSSTNSPNSRVKMHCLGLSALKSSPGQPYTTS